MKFTISNLISFDDFKLLIESDFPNQKAKIIVKALEYDFILLDNGDMFIYQDNATYKKQQLNKSIIQPYITLLLESSFDNFTELQQIKLQNTKKYKTIYDKTTIQKYLDETIFKLMRDDITWDTTFCEIHFRNGYMDLNDLKFKQREKGKHFITKFINRDYCESSVEQRKLLLSYLTMIYPHEADRDCVLKTLGSALSGTTIKEQEIMFLLGTASAGKSFTLELTMAAIEENVYFKELKSDTFTLGNSKIDKIMNSYSSEPQVRISWINEPEDKKIDTSLFKKFVEGKIETTKLYNEGSHNIKHYSKAFITANTMPNFKIDSGIARRFRGYTHGSKFTDDAREVDHKKHIFIKDVDLLNKIKRSDALLNAWFDILAIRCNEWLNGDLVVFTENFSETKDTVISSNDWIQDFIDSNLKITGDIKHRIPKQDMFDAIRTECPGKHYLSHIQIIGALKDKGIEFNAQFRCEKTKGCFVAVLFQTPHDEVLRDYEYKVKYEDAMARIAILEKEIKLLKSAKVSAIETPISNEELDDILEMMGDI